MRRRKQNELLREKLSITQADLANYLAVSRSLLSMYEQDLRFLPPAASLKLANLEILHHNLQQGKSKKPKMKAMHPTLQKHHDKTKKEIREQVETSKYKKMVLQRKLNNMITEHVKAEVWMQMLDDMLAKTPQSKENKIDLLWLELQQYETLQKMLRHGSASQLKLQAKMEVLEAEINTYNKMHEIIDSIF